MYAFCWRSGVIEFGPRIPKGAMPVIRGPAKIVKEAVSAQSRHAYDGGTLLVPGIPEADTDDAAHNALKRFQKYVRISASRRRDEAMQKSPGRKIMEIA